MKWSEGTAFENPPTGSFVARCYSVIDLGTQVHKPFRDDEEPRHSRDVRISFELPTTKMTGKYNKEVKGKPFGVHMTLTASLHPKSNLRKKLVGWRGKDFGPGEAEKFDPRKLPGLPCRVNLVQNGDYVNIDSISPLSKEEAKSMPKQINKSVFFSLAPDEFDKKVFESLHEGTRKKIEKTPEYKALNGGGPGEEPQPDAPADEQEVPTNEEGVDIPF